METSAPIPGVDAVATAQDPTTMKSWEGKTKSGSHLGSNIKIENNDGGVGPGERQSTQALLEELKKSVAPRNAHEDRKSEPHGVSQPDATHLSIQGKDGIKSLRVPSVTM